MLAERERESEGVEQQQHTAAASSHSCRELPQQQQRPQPRAVTCLEAVGEAGQRRATAREDHAAAKLRLAWRRHVRGEKERYKKKEKDEEEG
jgi:hypothetical protein